MRQKREAIDRPASRVAPRFARLNVAIGLIAIAVATIGLALAVYRFTATSGDGAYERTTRVFWTLWVGTCLLGGLAGLRCMQHRLEAAKLAGLYAATSGLVALGWITLVLVYFGGRVVTPELAWSLAGGIGWPVTLVVLTTRRSFAAENPETRDVT